MSQANQNTSSSGRWLNLFAKGLLLFAMLAVLVPLLPLMPVAGLDPSWRLGMNVGVAEGMKIGEDIIFTFGPYAAVFTRYFHPATDELMVWGSLFLAFAGWVAALMAAGRRSSLPLVILALALPTSLFARDALLFLLPLLIGLAIVGLRDRYHSRLASALVMIIVLAPLGFLPLIKGTLLIACIAVMVLAAVLLIARREWLMATLTVCIPPIVIVAAWLIAEQPLDTLRIYITNMLPIVQGYTEAMALTGSSLEVIVYLAAACTISLAVLLQEQPRWEKIYVFLMFCLILFLSFKSSFVRHDGHHALIASIVLILVSICTLLFRFNRASGFAVVIACTSGFFISASYLHSPVRDYLSSNKNVYGAAAYGAYLRLFQPASLKASYDLSLENLGRLSPIPLLEGGSDIYSHQQWALIASGNNWAPRPVFQSYSVYTDSLAEQNRAYLASNSAPGNIFFNVEPIDGRFPAIEDGLSWLELLGRYKPVQFLQSHLQLERTSGYSMSRQEIFKGTYRLGELVTIPHRDTPIFMSMDITPSLLGRLVSFLFKPNQLKLVVRLQDGRTYSYRFIATMARSGFVVSPLINNTKQFGFFWGRTNYLSAESVESVQVTSSSWGSWFWQENIHVVIESLDGVSKFAVEDIYKFSKAEPNLFSEAETRMVTCEGAFKIVDRVSAADEILHASGWLISSEKQPLVPALTYFVLQDSEGVSHWFETSSEIRPEIGDHFGDEKLSASGFSIAAVVGKLQGSFEVGLAFVQEGAVHRCSNIRSNLEVRARQPDWEQSTE
ncbi:hypothetical protein [Halopseudomonas salina]|uniref:hypothetical protein n=1 Tax=Halopseudomonas salina TaxID=1323744 RepID=UPI001238C76C|nr:hypothetical protein [Halopseudomonas salina]